MKTKLNITVEQNILADAKRYANHHNISLSQIIELHFKYITKVKPKKNILDLLKELPKPQIPEDADLKDNYYRQRKNKYGF